MEMVWKVDVPDDDGHGYMQVDMTANGIVIDLFDENGEAIAAWEVTPQEMANRMLGIGKGGAL